MFCPPQGFLFLCGQRWVAARHVGVIFLEACRFLPAPRTPHAVSLRVHSSSDPIECFNDLRDASQPRRARRCLTDCDFTSSQTTFGASWRLVRDFTRTSSPDWETFGVWDFALSVSFFGRSFRYSHLQFKISTVVGGSCSHVVKSRSCGNASQVSRNVQKLCYTISCINFKMSELFFSEYGHY